MTSIPKKTRKTVEQQRMSVEARKPYSFIIGEARKLLKPPPEEYVEHRLAWLESRVERKITLSKLQKKYLQQKGLCIYCDNRMWLFKRRKSRPHNLNTAKFVATADHIIPRSMGGDNGDDNIACACAYCNSCRGTIPANEFLMMRQA